jgi:hemin uptake protein HemP
VNGPDKSSTTSPTSRESHPDAPDAKPQATRQVFIAGDAPVQLDTAELFGGRSEVRLLHRGQEYRLRVTKQGKLILTK